MEMAQSYKLSSRRGAEVRLTISALNRHPNDTRPIENDSQIPNLARK